MYVHESLTFHSGIPTILLQNNKKIIKQPRSQTVHSKFSHRSATIQPPQHLLPPAAPSAYCNPIIERHKPSPATVSIRPSSGKSPTDRASARNLPISRGHFGRIIIESGAEHTPQHGPLCPPAPRDNGIRCFVAYNG